ncbi:hypothetical protein J4403_04535 [Candidatus Woesearchaeota archaeon]|nr:hypothetical protein [Candidatus Woesearchaeota archaeon]
MLNKHQEIALNSGFNLGKKITKLIENLFPKIRDKKQNLYNFKSPYLERFNYTYQENFKRYLKLSIQTTLAVFFFAIVTLFVIIIQNKITLLWEMDYISFFKARFIVLILIILFFIFVSYKASRE